ncbi:peptide chain release factor N(5)-glutamine methyltransferase [Roseinatronobacter alkalisoli]|uniref:Release factor glutamine methyltransferase n=1 Tax=Roseinatronobacter alkalisoli TaxID=3028235 RepID=A0ABT5T8M3_9RHOB|nr:peptide chain release factor N(5)-glutamine methyltransferase [Roseinatronobacter sp. HJB301]MDD7971473.1 peptide chain release factor N(5)-glutamine methyltransferase [Roseinatronobacter sp. HJB301]
MSTAAQALAAAVAQLRAAGIEGAPRDARWLLAHVLGIDAARLTLVLPDPISDAQAARFCSAIEARARHQPVAQIIGYRDFWGRRFRVTPDVLDPRPETETLIDAALARDFSNVLDLGTGSGAILLTLLAERAGAQGVGVDLSPAALRVAAENARQHGVQDRAQLRHSDWFSGVTGRFDLIVSNPPYISAPELDTLSAELRQWEPRMALVPDADDGSGLAAYRLICAQAPAFLRPGGGLVVEIGVTQGQDVQELFTRAGFEDIAVLRDLSGHDRVVLGHIPQ